MSNTRKKWAEWLVYGIFELHDMKVSQFFCSSYTLTSDEMSELKTKEGKVQFATIEVWFGEATESRQFPENKNIEKLQAINKNLLLFLVL